MALHLVLYFSTEYHNSRQNIIIPIWKYLVDIRSDALLNHFWEYMNGKLFVVLSTMVPMVPSYSLASLLKEFPRNPPFKKCYKTPLIEP